MTMRLKRFLFAALAATCLAAAAPAAAVQSTFRAEFTKSYEENRFEYLAILIRRNKAAVPAEVRAIVEEAAAKETFGEKMYLLDIASAMASMYRDWHNDPKPLAIVEAAQQAELKREEERKAEAEKWARLERYTGNILMGNGAKKTDAKRPAPTLFPHWTHRLWYECAACHDSVFPMKRSNAISHAGFRDGKLCAACHDGNTAFGTKSAEDCSLCHQAGTPGEERVVTPAKLKLSAAALTAERLGAKIEATRPLPRDKFGSIDWNAARETGLLQGVASIDAAKGTKKPDARDNVILFEIKSMPGIKGVLFSHKTHTVGIECSSCHPAPFKDALGANSSTMTKMAEGSSCGLCHGKAAFKPADCGRCHTVTPGADPGKGVLKRP